MERSAEQAAVSADNQLTLPMAEPADRLDKRLRSRRMTEGAKLGE